MQQPQRNQGPDQLHLGVRLGLLHVEELLDEEVTALAGGRYARKDAEAIRAVFGVG